MLIPLLDLKAQYQELRPELDAAVRDVMESAAFVGGPKVEELEAAIATYCGTRHAVSCASGTDALILILEAMGIGDRDEVITTPFTFFATAEAIRRVGATPVFVDIAPGTYNLDATLLGAAVTARTRAIMPVHLFGSCVDMATVREVADANDLRIIEDACQAIGATFGDRRAGALGDAAAFSFFPSKNLGAAGDGGVVTTDDAQLADRIRLLANHGMGPEKYHHAVLGHNSRLDALQAAILLVKLGHLDRWNEERRAAASVYDELFADLPLQTPVRPSYGESVVHLYVVRTPHAQCAMAALGAAGIATATYYPLSLHLQEALADLGYRSGDLPNAEAAQEETFAIPCFPGITLQQQHRVADVLSEVLGDGGMQA